MGTLRKGEYIKPCHGGAFQYPMAEFEKLF